jgi:galactokinase
MFAHHSTEIFVPGRICLLGEHSDWAGLYRSQNSAIIPGVTIITGTDQGIYARFSSHAKELILTSTDSLGKVTGPYRIRMDPNYLLRESKNHTFFSYIAGVSYKIIETYNVGGLIIDNYYTDLPIKKGLSSSAAICVLTARAFNRAYQLNLSVEQEMEFAFKGEVLTGSQCGRMDQGCAYGNKPIQMIFDGNNLTIKEIEIGSNIYLVIVDLNASKDTRMILHALNACYPFPLDEKSARIHNLFGRMNQEITADAIIALRTGNAKKLGILMNKAQVLFDRYAIPICPEQFTAPKLHSVLNEHTFKQYIWGGKGVGSQGDGTAQFLVKSAEAQSLLTQLIYKKFGMKSYSLTIHATT